MNKLKINEVEYDMSSPINLEFRDRYIRSFGDVPPPRVNAAWLHVDGFQLDITSPTDHEFDVQIYDNTSSLIYEAKLKNNMYCKLNRKYFNGIRYVISHDGIKLKEETISFTNRRVLISFESSSLGDTISWVPYCEEFRKTHNCEVIVSTFKNFLFEKTYPNLKFINPGDPVQDIHTLLRIGWFYETEKEPEYPSTIPLQKSASNILGLPFKEVQTNVHFEPKERPYEEKYICIATNSTAGCKLWNYPGGWEELANHLSRMGYKIVNISQDGDKIEGVENIEDDSMENTMNVIHHSEFIIGLSSGLSWLSWGMGKHVVMISNFTESDHEFLINCTRITNPDVCHGCWNNPMFKFDKGDWYWCPEHKDTERQFECHKSITSEMVINQIQHLLS